MKVLKFTFLSLCVFLFCSRTYAYDCEVDGIYYNRISATEFEVTKGDSPYSGNIVIPSEVNYKGKTYKVSVIGENSFIGAILSSLTIPQNQLHFKKDAFYPCVIDTIHVASLRSWLDKDFDSTTSNPLGYLIWTSRYTSGGRTIIDTIGISNPILCIDGVETTDIIIPNDITDIKKNVLYGYKRLKSVKFGDNVNTIGESAFQDCKGLESVSIGKNVSEIGKAAFKGCGYLAEVSFSQKDKHTGLAIMSEAFQNCVSLSNINLPRAQISIGGHAFQGCSKLDTAMIDGVTYIDYDSFRDCKSLKKISIGNSIAYIGGYAFWGCDSIKEVHISDISNWCKCFRELNSNPLIEGCKLFIDGDTITNLLITDEVKILERYSFFHQTSIITATIGKGVEKILCNNFNGCTNLSTLYILAQTPPEIEILSSSDGKIIWPFDDVNFTWTDLFVPTGTLEQYKRSKCWKEFKSIREFDPDTLEIYLRPFTISSSKGGKVIYQEEEISGATKTIYVSPSKSASFFMVADKGYQLSRVLLDGEDITTTLNNNVLYLDNLSSATSLTVVFEETPIFLTIQYANSGNIKQIVEYGKSYSFQIESADGWKINTVLYNGQDVTNQLSDDGFFITPAIAENSTLNVSFESTVESAVRQTYNNNDIKVYANGNAIYIKGIKQGEDVSVYDLGGTMIKSLISKHESIGIPLPCDHVYIVKVRDKVFKVRL